MTCWCLPETFVMLWSRWWLSRKNYYGRWNLGPLPPAGNQESEQRMAPYLLTKTENIPHTTICGKGYADFLLEWTRGDFGALHAQEVHCDQCNTDLPKNRLRPAMKSKQRGHLSTGVLLQHNDARPHTARSSVATIQDLSFECLPRPPHSPDLKRVLSGL